MCVVRTLLDRNDKIVKENDNKTKEEAHIRKALSRCGYPNWTIDRVKDQMKTKAKNTATKSKKDSDSKSKGLVIIPYVAGVSEKVSRGFQKAQHKHSHETTYYNQKNAYTP